MPRRPSEGLGTWWPLRRRWCWTLCRVRRRGFVFLSSFLLFIFFRLVFKEKTLAQELRFFLFFPLRFFSLFPSPFFFPRPHLSSSFLLRPYLSSKNKRQAASATPTAPGRRSAPGPPSWRWRASASTATEGGSAASTLPPPPPRALLLLLRAATRRGEEGGHRGPRRSTEEERVGKREREKRRRKENERERESRFIFLLLLFSSPFLLLRPFCSLLLCTLSPPPSPPQLLYLVSFSLSLTAQHQNKKTRPHVL